MKVNCVECGKEFELKTSSKTLEGVDIIYAECPHCGKRYLSFVVDKEMKERFDKTARELEKYQDKSQPFHKREKARRKHQRLVQENRRLMEQKKAECQYLIVQVIG